MKHLFTLSLLLALLVTGSACTTQKKTVAPAKETNVTEAVLGNIMARRSIRKYTDQPIGRDTLDRILLCGINAPNGMNQQHYEVKVVTDPTSTAYLADNLHGLYRAPVYIFIAAGHQYDMSRIDCGLLAENICLAATAYGLGSINLGMPVRALKEKPELLQRLGFGEDYELCLVIALGHPAEAPDAKPRKAEKVQFVTVTE
ncbi:MAG: nitroreductase [Bacteroidaceae bacterium]|nr:nitroreductase [Bacteroidaceae bacterium]